MKPRSRIGSMVPSMLGMLVKKADTERYPVEKAHTDERFRGRLAFDAGLCVGCKLCQRVCPSDAIVIEKTEDGAFRAIVRLDKCIFCGQCVESCRKGALRNTTDFELASGDKGSLTVEL